MSHDYWQSPSGARFAVGGGEPFRLDDALIARTFRAQLTPRIADLLDIAMECYARDRLTTRQLNDPIGRGWCRQIPVTLQVRDLAFWQAPQTAGALQGLLDWLTGDEWQPCFVHRKSPNRPEETQGTLFSLPAEGPAAVGCFSGGLDSFGGAAIDLGEDPNIQLILVGASGTSRARALQNMLGNELSWRTRRVQPLLITANLVGAGRRAQDRQHRTRGLVFLSLAAATALIARVPEVRMYENGIGSINLPYGRAQIGTHMARSAHPRTLVAMHELIELMEEGHVRFCAPRVFETKAQLVRRIPNEFHELAGRTQSCDTWSSSRQRQAKGAVRCGRCSSCLLRRQSLVAAGWLSTDHGEDYKVDAFRSDQADDDSFELRLMLSQVADLQTAVNDANPWAALVESFPQLVAARDALVDLGENDIENRLVSLYQNYVREWRRVPSNLVDRFLGQDLAA